MEIKIKIPDNFADDYIGDKFKDFFSRVIADITGYGACGIYEKEIAEMFLKAFDESIEANNICNCKHNHNFNSDEPCCRCDSKVSENDDTINKVTSLEIIVRMIDNKPYYEIKYKKIGEDYYHVGYSSYNLYNVLKWYSECFELVNAKITNADRIRNMSDEELSEFLDIVEEDGISSQRTNIPCDCCYEKTECSKCWKDWLQSEAE